LPFGLFKQRVYQTVGIGGIEKEIDKPIGKQGNIALRNRIYRRFFDRHGVKDKDIQKHVGLFVRTSPVGEQFFTGLVNFTWGSILLGILSIKCFFFSFFFLLRITT
jgi:hypothetical protein